MNLQSAGSNEDVVVITVGRATDNTIVLESSNISSHHARLTICEGQILLEDLGSTNGTSISSVDNKVSRIVVDIEEKIFLGSTPFSVRELLARASTPSVYQPLQGDGYSKSPINRVSRQAMALIGLVIAGVAICLFVNQPRRNASDSGISTPVGQTAAAKNEASAARSEQTLQKTIEQSLFVIVVASPEDDIAFRVGTCFAINEHHLATSATAIRAIEEFQENGYSEVFLFNPTTTQKLPVAAMAAHPRYVQATENARSAQKAYDAIIDQYEDEPPPLENVEQIESELLSHKSKALEALDTQAMYDVAIIESHISLSTWLNSELNSKALRPNLKLVVYGVAFDAEDPYFDPNERMAASQFPARVHQLIRYNQSEDQSLAATTTNDHRTSSFLGAPIMRASGEVVAIYSRPIPPPEDSEQNDSSSGFEAPLVNRLFEVEKPSSITKVLK